MAFIYNLTDSWTDAATTWNGIKLAVTNSGSDSSSKLLNLTVTGASTASFVVDKSGNLVLNGSVNKITMTAPATGATLTLADNSTFITSGAYSSTFTFSGTTTLTFPTSGTVTALGNTTTGSGSIVLATSPTLVSPALGTPSSVTLTNATGLPISGISATGTPSISTYLRGDGSWATLSGGGSVTSVGQTFTGGLISVSGSPVTTTGTLALTVAGTSGGVPYFSSSSTWASSAALTANAIVVGGGAGAAPSTVTTGAGILTFLGTPSSANLASAVTDETGSGSLVFSTAPTFGTNITVGTASSSTGIVNLKGTTSGTVGVSVADAAGTWTLKLPTTAGTNGYYLQTDGAGNTTWAAGGGGGGGSPGGSNTQIQYNNAGAFGGSAAFTFDGTSIVNIGVASTTSGTLALYNSSSANAVSLKSGNNSAAWSLTLPTSGGTNGYFLQTDGSGNTTWAAAGGSGTVNSGTANQLAYYATSTNAVSGNANATISSGALTLGVAGSAAGSLILSGSTSGTSTISVPAAAGTGTTFTLPSSNGTNNYVLTTNGSGVTSWAQVSLTAGVTGTLPVANGGTGITSFGTGVATALGNNTNGASGLAVLNGSGYLAVAQGGTGLGSGTSGGVLYYSATGTLASSAALAANALVIGGGAGVAPSTTTTGAGILTFLGTPSSANLAAAVTDETGSGSLVFATSPSLTTPTLGVASATSINKVTITAPATSATLTISDGKTLAASNTITLAATNDSQTYTFPAATCNIGYLEVPQNSQSTAYTAVLADSGKQIFHPSTDNNARTFTIPANGSVAYPIGTVLTFVNMANTVTIAITTDTMYLAGTGTTGPRTLAAYGVATAIKMTSTTWLISGTGLT